MGTTKNIQSIERASAILELFEIDNKPKSVKEISDTLSLSKSTAFGIISTLANLGYLSQDQETLKYSLGLKILSLGSVAAKGNLMVSVANHHLQKLSFKFQETCLLAIEEHGFVVYIDKTESSGSISINTRIGTKKELPSTGVGKCFLAFMPKENAQNIINLGLVKRTNNTLVNEKDLWQELETIRKQGFAVDNEEYELGISCFAVPVFNKNGSVVASFCLTGPTSKIKSIDPLELSSSLIESSREISKELNI